MVCTVAGTCIHIIACGLLLACPALGAPLDDNCPASRPLPPAYRFQLDGDSAIVFKDASGVFPVHGSPFSNPNVVARALRKRFLNDTAYTLDNNVLYIARKDGGVLVDAGSGPNAEEGLGAGSLHRTLEAHGIPRDSITAVLISHCHSDHLGGVVEDLESLKPAFPKATIYVPRVEREYWTVDPIDFGATKYPPELLKLQLTASRSVLFAVQGQLKFFEFGDEVIPGITSYPTPWHTPGSTAFVIKDGPSALVYAGDGLAHKVISVEDPTLGVFPDVHPVAAVGGRYELLDTVVEKRYKLLVPHAEFPGVMHVSHMGLGFQAAVPSCASVSCS